MPLCKVCDVRPLRLEELISRHISLLKIVIPNIIENQFYTEPIIWSDVTTYKFRRLSNQVIICSPDFNCYKVYIKNQNYKWINQIF